MLTSFDVTCDTNLFVNTSLVKLRYQQLELFNSDALTSAHKIHVQVVFQLHVHVHHSLSCVPLQQYRACVVDSLGLGITCVLYHRTMCTRHLNFASFAFHAIPIFRILIFTFTCISYIYPTDKTERESVWYIFSCDPCHDYVTSYMHIRILLYEPT